MCVVVNVNLAIPAAIAYGFLKLKYMDNYEELINLMAFSSDMVVEHANRMKSWGLGRVIVNFKSEDVLKEFTSNPDFFSPIDGSQMYRLKHQGSSKKLTENDIKDIIKYYVSKINYPPNVLRTVGLLNDNIYTDSKIG